MMEIPLDEAVYFDVITSTPSTGAAVDADSTPTFAVYEESTDTDIGIGGNLTKRTSLTGNYRGTFTASTANGFEVGKWYSVICSATVGAVAGKCRALGFRCVAAENTAGFRTIDVMKVNNTAQTAGDIAALINTVDDFLDTEVAAIKAQTDLIPASPASTTNIIGGTITTVTNLTNAPTSGDLTATMKTSVATAALTTQMTESYAADGVAPTLAQSLFLTQQALTEFAISGTTTTVKKLDGSTTAATLTLDSATAPTSVTRAT